MARGNGRAGRGWRWWAGLGALAVVVGLAVWWLPSAFYPQARPPTVTAVRVFLIAVVVTVGAWLGLAGGVHRSRRVVGWGLWSVLIVAGVVAVGLVVWRVPPALYATSPVEGRAQAIALTRTGVLTAAAGLIVLANLLETRRATNLTHARELDSQKEIRRANNLTHARELYTAAVGQLGSDTLDVRLGGIYALERIATDSAADHRTVVEVLSAFVREHTIPGRPGTLRRQRDRPAPSDPASGTPPTAPTGPDTDVQAALTVLSRLPTRNGIARANLTCAHLANAELAGADLTGARLAGADLTGARLEGADLTGAYLFGATLTGAYLNGANLNHAELGSAELDHANLTRATLTGAVLQGATLTLAWLFGADLTDAEFLYQDQLDAAFVDTSTKLPEGLDRPPFPRS